MCLLTYYLSHSLDGKPLLGASSGNFISKTGIWQLVDSEGPSALRFFHLFKLEHLK